MKPEDWFPWYPHSFRKKTLSLTLEQDGAYRRLIDEYMITRKPLPDNDIALARILGVSGEQWERIASAVRAYFEPHASGLVHARCEHELSIQDKLIARRSTSAKEAAKERWREHNRNKKLDAARKRAVKQSLAERNADAMRFDATLSKKDITTTFSAAAREEEEENQTTGSRPTAPCGSAVARQSDTCGQTKWPSATSELETSIREKGWIP